jgi:hypothetical protein
MVGEDVKFRLRTVKQHLTDRKAVRRVTLALDIPWNLLFLIN